MWHHLRGGSLLGKEFEQKQGSSTLQVQLKILLLWKNTQTEKTTTTKINTASKAY